MVDPKHAHKLSSGGVVAAVLILGGVPAWAKPAECFTTDDGQYACDFRLVEYNGSFAISAPGKPTYTLIMDAPGYAYGFVNFGDRNIALPGPYERETADPACWLNIETGTRICAW